MLQLISVITNRMPTNTTFTVNMPTNIPFSLSNYSTESTLVGISNLLANMQTNNFPLTNSSGTNVFQTFTLTNYATESTLAGMSNAFFGTNGSPYTNNLAGAYLANQGGVDTNWDFSGTNWSVENGATTNAYTAKTESGNASTELQGAESTLSQFIASMTPADIEENFGDPDMTYEFNYGGGHTTIMDFNPLHNDQILNIFTIAKNLFSWVIAFFYLLRCAQDSVKAIELVEMGRGTVVTSPTTKKTYT